MIVFTIIGMIVTILIVIIFLLGLFDAITYAIIVTWMHSLSEFNENVSLCNKIRWVVCDMLINFTYRLGKGSSVRSVECNGIRYDPQYHMIRKIK